MKYTVNERRNFLFLQGSASRFFGQLGAALRSRGHSVDKVNFNGGDVAFWPLPDAINYRGGLDGWPAYLTALIARRGVTDIVLLGDCRPLHQCAVRVAADLDIRVYVLEDGYLRPNWITLERGGVNALSSLGRCPEWFVRAAADVPPWRNPTIAVNSMARRAIEDIIYVLASAAGRAIFPDYQSHRPWSSWTEYKGGARRALRKPGAKRALAALIDRLETTQQPFYLFPLQLEADSQIRLHSRFGGVRPVIELVIASFARGAPAHATLVITEHPLDTCPIDWRDVVNGVAAEHGVADRVRFFEGGSPERTIQASRGVITVNSTLGYLALSLGKPLIALGKAIYAMPKLTFQEGLDRFWTEGEPPDEQIFDAFRRVVATRTQINGSFYSDAGLKLAVAGAVQRIEADVGELASQAREQAATAA